MRFTGEVLARSRSCSAVFGAATEAGMYERIPAYCVIFASHLVILQDSCHINRVWKHYELLAA